MDDPIIFCDAAASGCPDLSYRIFYSGSSETDHSKTSILVVRGNFSFISVQYGYRDELFWSISGVKGLLYTAAVIFPDDIPYRVFHLCKDGQIFYLPDVH